MPNHLCLTVTFLDSRFHGRRDGGEPEWPPSPLRLFQAIVAAAAAPTGRIDDSTATALRWFERLPPPRIAAPAARLSEPYRLSVPNNAMDLVTKAWARGNYDGSGDANPATHRTMKTVRPMHMVGGDQVRYTWTLPDPLPEDDRRHAEVIRIAVRGVVALGWGVDLVVGYGELLLSVNVDERVDGSSEQWEPDAAANVPVRVPRSGTLDALGRRHRAFLGRVTDDGFVPVPPLTMFAITKYRNANVPLQRPFAAFKLVRPDDTSERFTTFPQYGAVHVAAMLRHAACDAAKRDLDPGIGRDEAWGSRVVAGHGMADKRRSKDDGSPRLSYLSLPSFEMRGPEKAPAVGNIRRVIVAEFTGEDTVDSIAWVRQRLNGELLIDERTGEALSMLAPFSDGDYVLQQYTGGREGSREWASVTPVILPGYDDGKPTKRERLLNACLDHAGLLGFVEHYESRPVSWFPGAVSSARFRDEQEENSSFRRRPEYFHHLPAVHVLLRLSKPIRGPLSLGSGRHCGLGVLARYT